MMSLFESIWARITGADKGKKYPEQQGVGLGRVGNFTIIFPYGTYADLPDDALLRVIAPGIAIPVTIDRPSDLENGEPAFFHPSTNTRIIPRNDGSLDIETGNGGTAPVNINCTSATIFASENCTFDTPYALFSNDIRAVGDIYARYGTPQQVGVATHDHDQPNDSAGNSEQRTDPARAGS